jgi:hypothetical protein
VPISQMGKLRHKSVVDLLKVICPFSTKDLNVR